LRHGTRSHRHGNWARERHRVDERQVRPHSGRHLELHLPRLSLDARPADWTGRRLVWSWTANAAAGPPIAFDIHSHIGGYAEYYNTTADRANNSWNVPGSSDYAVQWTNPNPLSENVTYAFQLIPPPLVLWPFYLLLVAPLSMIGALVWYSRRKKKGSKA